MSILSFSRSLRWCRGQFRGVCQRVENQIRDMPISQPVMNVVAGAAANNQAFTAKNAQPLRNRGEFLIDHCHDFSYAHFAFFEQFQNPQPWSVPHCPKQPRRRILMTPAEFSPPRFCGREAGKREQAL